MNYAAVPLTKEAGIAGKIIKPVWKGVQYGAGSLVRGIMPTPATASKGAKMWGRIVKGGAVGGLAYGGYKLGTLPSQPRSRDDYRTMLRNNILAGRIKPEELTPSDLVAVQKLGLR